jgi:hypothetical protein
MENTKSISSARVSMVVSELTDSVIFRTNITVSMRTNGMYLQVIPICISI